jgi:hypothetical protein
VTGLKGVFFQIPTSFGFVAALYVLWVFFFRGCVLFSLSDMEVLQATAQGHQHGFVYLLVKLYWGTGWAFSAFVDGLDAHVVPVWCSCNIRVVPYRASWCRAVLGPCVGPCVVEPCGARAKSTLQQRTIHTPLFDQRWYSRAVRTTCRRPRTNTTRHTDLHSDKARCLKKNKF